MTASAAARAASGLRTARTQAMPRRAKATAVAAPMPRAAPVTRATRPAGLGKAVSIDFKLFRTPSIGYQACRFDAVNGTNFIVIGGITGDSDGAHHMTFAILDKHATGYRDHTAVR